MTSISKATLIAGVLGLGLMAGGCSRNATIGGLAGGAGGAVIGDATGLGTTEGAIIGGAAGSVIGDSTDDHK